VVIEAVTDYSKIDSPFVIRVPKTPAKTSPYPPHLFKADYVATRAV
jgi:hypothetical protein